VDTVEVLLGDQVLATTFAGGHGMVGPSSIRFKTPDGNLVVLPVQ
jgi:hypothetical protein